VPSDVKHRHFSYIPIYLHYIIMELLKNSCNATAKAAGTQEGMAARPIKIVICADTDRVAIRISDLAGGIPFDVGDHVFDYLYRSDGERSELSGYGFGLPLSRLYAQYLGGSLTLMSMPDYGVDAFVFLRRIDATLGDITNEGE